MIEILFTKRNPQWNSNEGEKRKNINNWKMITSANPSHVQTCQKNLITDQIRIDTRNKDKIENTHIFVKLSYQIFQ